MNLYKISQTQKEGYDTYDAAIVCASSEGDAKTINPDLTAEWSGKWSCWCGSPDDVTVELIGLALEGAERGIVLASFNSG